MRLAVGEGGVGFAEAREVGIDFQGVSDIDDENEGRIAFGGGEGADVLLGLRARLEHRDIPRWSAALGGTLARAGDAECLHPEQGGLGRLGAGALLGFQHKTPAAIQIDPPDRARAVAMIEMDIALEDVVVFRVVGDGGIGPRNSQNVA